MKREAEQKQRNMQATLEGQPCVINAPIVWILGGPGCGKGTQCAKIVEKFGFTHISSGDLLRAEVTSGSEKGKELEAIMKEGKLVPNEDVLQLLEKAILKVKDSPGFLIDGYPREKHQGTEFEKFIAPADLIVFLDCTDETMKKRILHRAQESDQVRADDNEATIKKRLETFRKNTNDIIEQYKDKTVIINAERSVDEIFEEVFKIIDAIVAKRAA